MNFAYNILHYKILLTVDKLDRISFYHSYLFFTTVETLSAAAIIKNNSIYLIFRLLNYFTKQLKTYAAISALDILWAYAYNTLKGVIKTNTPA